MTGTRSGHGGSLRALGYPAIRYLVARRRIPAFQPLSVFGERSKARQAPANLASVPKVYVAVLIIDPSIETKIRGKDPPLTGDEVRAAVLYSNAMRSGWEDSEVHGRRLVVRTTTYAGIEFVAYMLPADEDDPEEGTFILKTAIPKPRPQYLARRN